MATPLSPKNNCCVPLSVFVPKVASIVPSNVRIDTQAEAREIALDAEKAG